MLKRLASLIFLIVLLFVWNDFALADPIFAFENLEYSVNAKKTIDLKPILQGAELTKNAKYIWESENTEIAKVSSTGKVTGVAAGQTTIKVTVTDTSDVSYSTTCILNVIQPVTKISYGKKQGIKVPVGVDFKFEPTVSPEDATNPKLRFTSSNPTICTVSENGTLRGLAANKSCDITVEATDGSGVKAKFKVYVKTFIVDTDELVLTERKTYYLELEPVHTSDDYCIKYNRKGIVRLENLIPDMNGWYEIHDEDVIDEKTGRKTKKTVLHIEPLKTGTQTLTFYDIDATWGASTTKESISIVVKPTAVYGETAFPSIQYAKVTADPQSFVGKTVSLSGSISSIDNDDKGIIQYRIATKGTTDNIVVACVPKEFTKFATFNIGEKVKVYGTWLTPETTTTETGLTVTNPTLQIEKINDSIFNSELKYQKAQ